VRQAVGVNRALEAAPALHWLQLGARVRNSLRDATSVPCFVVSADAGQVVVQAKGESRTFGCDTDLLRQHVSDGASAWGIEPPVEIDWSRSCS
jgi:hypothetical protein